MFAYFKKLLCSHKDITRSYKFEESSSITLPDGRVLTLVAKVLNVNSKCAHCGKVLRREVIYED